MSVVISPSFLSRSGLSGSLARVLLPALGFLAIDTAFIVQTAVAQDSRAARTATQISKPPAAPAKAATPAPAGAPVPVDVGKRVFRQCASCHSVAAGQNLVGPSLHGLFTRKAGTAPGFRYSTAMQKSGIVWNEAVFLEYIGDPRKKVPGTTMAFAGVRKPEDRAALYAWLKTATK